MSGYQTPPGKGGGAVSFYLVLKVRDLSQDPIEESDKLLEILQLLRQS
jgi:hypothetical protein